MATLNTLRAPRALETANPRRNRVGRQIDVATLARGLHQEHGTSLALRPAYQGRRVCQTNGLTDLA